MALEPVVVEFTPPTPPGGGLWSKLPKLGPRGTKILIAVTSVLIIISMVIITVFTVASNNPQFSKKHGLDVNLPQTSAVEKSDAAQPGGGVATGIGGTSGKNAPVVTLTAEPASVTKGKSSVLKWSVTNNPNSCVASDDWSGDKSVKGGSETTPGLTKEQNYLFTLTCKTATGTGFSTVAVSVAAPSTGTTTSSASGGKPIVTIAGAPSLIYAGDSSTIVWEATGSPTSCAATGDWSGLKGVSGNMNTGILSSVRQYSYTITCKNASGTSDSKSAYVTVQAPPADVPIVTISSNPVGPIVPGSNITLSWASTNSPTSCVASGDWSGNKSGTGSQKITNLSSIKTYQFTINCSNSAGGTLDTASVQVIPDPPVVSLTVSPSSIYVGNSSTLSWSATNSPSSCTASGSWSGVKSASGTTGTGIKNSTGTYAYTLSCVNAGGTGYASNVPLTVTNPPAPIVNLSANPISVTVGSSSNLTWSTSNNPTSCSASGSWSGTQSSSGTMSTGALNTAQTYTYNLTCGNAGGTDSASTSVTATSGGASTPPVVSMNASSTTIGTGSSTTINWSATNSPTSCTASNAWSGTKSGSGSQSTGTINTAGTYTYSLSCSNSAGSGSGSTTVTVVAVPVVSVSLSPSSINTGSSATVSWSATNSPSSCTAGGSWSGSKAASGSQGTGTMNSTGTYTYSLSCTNAGGTVSNSATLTVSNPAPIYCSGLTPCYGPADLASHSGPGNCWGWNLTWVVNITSFRPSHKGGIQSGSTSTIENASATCDHDINAILSGSASIPGYKDSNGSTKHSHASSTVTNSGSSALAGFRVGYYDASKP